MLRRSITFALLPALAMMLLACQPPGGGGEGEELFVTIATGGQSGNYYPIGGSLASLYEDELGATTTVEATGASVDNINLLDEGRAEMALVQADAASQAYAGEGPFEEPVDSFSAVASLYPQYVQVITIAGSGVETMEDLAGKRVSVGAPNSGVELNARAVTGAFGLSYEDFSPQYLSYSETIDGMRNGNIDAGFFTSGIPNPSVTDLSTTDEVRVVPLEGEGVQNLLNDYDYYSEAIIPAGTYEDQEEDVPTVTFANLLVVSNELDEDTVYELTRTMWENIERIQQTNAAAREITLETAQDGIPIELHPGAERYYSEQGMR
ncbi:TAXI family TRAP transporter solute-binding subunit [Rubrobacter taiwanensis]|uniref:TAXI family TRAP transporter solute-binding subunit n=1 Tax=Rubrobacter taiwanensis TaxID=185139 RepID=UPI001A9CCFEB|nr:TAXI family TRAP transporter solute-binding subunit [Rubrobacter taiwanensis]